MVQKYLVTDPIFDASPMRVMFDEKELETSYIVA